MIVIDLNAKICMAHLLLKPTFHHYSFIEGEVTTFNKFHIDGRIHKDFFDEKPEKEYSSWGEVQEYFLAVIKGKRTPLNFRLILSMAQEDFATFLNSRSLSFRQEEIRGLYLNFRYDGSNLQCVTGVSMNTFTMDKSLEQEWDGYAKEVLKLGTG
ncbi:DUF5721 family protein [Lachnospiraceae bacterium 42-17]